jgi:DNA replication protein DnaC
VGDPTLCVRCDDPVDRKTPAEDTPRWLRDKIARVPLLCDECVDRAEQARQRENAEAAARSRQQVVDRWRREAGLPELLCGLELADPEHPEAVDAAVRWAEREGWGLLLTGPVGVGKTHMAAAAAWRRLEFAPLRWFSVPVLFAHLALSFDNRLHEAAVGTLAGTGALVLDDLDKARPTEYAAEQIFAAVDQRVTAGAALAVTTNLGLDDLAAKWPEPYGAAIVDRLASHCEAFYLGGESRRKLGGLG